MSTNHTPTDTEHKITFDSAGGMVVTYCTCNRWTGRPAYRMADAQALGESHLRSMALAEQSNEAA